MNTHWFPFVRPAIKPLFLGGEPYVRGVSWQPPWRHPWILQGAEGTCTSNLWGKSVQKWMWNKGTPVVFRRKNPGMFQRGSWVPSIWEVLILSTFVLVDLWWKIICSHYDVGCAIGLGMFDAAVEGLILGCKDLHNLGKQKPSVHWDVYLDVPGS